MGVTGTIPVFHLFHGDRNTSTKMSLILSLTHPPLFVARTSPSRAELCLWLRVCLCVNMCMCNHRETAQCLLLPKPRCVVSGATFPLFSHPTLPFMISQTDTLLAPAHTQRCCGWRFDCVASHPLRLLMRATGAQQNRRAACWSPLPCAPAVAAAVVAAGAAAAGTERVGRQRTAAAAGAAAVSGPGRGSLAVEGKPPPAEKMLTAAAAAADVDGAGCGAG